MSGIAAKRCGEERSYRPPRASERAEVAEIVRGTGVFRPDEVDVALEVFDSFCEAPNVDYHALGAYAGGRMAGFALYGPTPCTVDTWDLYWIAVHPSSQGTGAGRGLLDRAEAHMRSAAARLCVIETSSREDYSATRGFYNACGYREVARVPGYYADGDDRVTYIKSL